MGNVKNMTFVKIYSSIIIKLIVIPFIVINCSSKNKIELAEKNDLEMGFRRLTKK